MWPEQWYPGTWDKDRQSEGNRRDAVLCHNGLPLKDPRSQGTLLYVIDVEDLDLACWLRIKPVAQHKMSRPFRRYITELLSPVTQNVR